MIEAAGEGDVMDGIDSAVTRRRMWRRVWICLAVFTLATPLLLWVAIDQGGKREWRRVKSELHARGVATSFAELATRYPGAGDVPEEENFCAIPWLAADKDGDPGAAANEMNTALGVFDRSASGAEDGGEMDGGALSALPTDIVVWAVHFRELREAEASADWPPSSTLGSLAPAEYVRRIERLEAEAEQRRADAAELDESEILKFVSAAVETFHPSVWTDLREALPRPNSRFLPLPSQRLSRLNGIDGMISSPAINVVFPLIKALRLRMVLAARSGDRKTVHECLEIGARFREAAVGEPFFIGYLIEMELIEKWLQGLAEVLWLREFAGDADFLNFGQQQLGRMDLAASFRQSYVSEFAFAVEGVEEQKKSRAYESYFDEISRSQEALLKVAPHGWFDLNTALIGDLNLRIMFPAMEGSYEFHELQAAFEQAERELASFEWFSELEQFSGLVGQSLVPCSHGKGRLPGNLSAAGDHCLCAASLAIGSRRRTAGGSGAVGA